MKIVSREGVVDICMLLTHWHTEFDCLIIMNAMKDNIQFQGNLFMLYRLKKNIALFSISSLTTTKKCLKQANSPSGASLKSKTQVRSFFQKVLFRKKDTSFSEDTSLEKRRVFY